MNESTIDTLQALVLAMKLSRTIGNEMTSPEVVYLALVRVSAGSLYAMSRLNNEAFDNVFKRFGQDVYDHHQEIAATPGFDEAMDALAEEVR